MRRGRGHAKYRLEPTAALVMVWARGLYRKGLAKRYLTTLDLSAAEKIGDQCHKVCAWYGEIILDRKYLIRHLVCERLGSARQPRRVIDLGSGKSPLSLELLESHAAAIDRVVEVDTRGIAVKKKIFRKIAPTLSKKIDFVSGDVTSERAKRAYDAGKNIPSIIAVEGLSYYMPVSKLKMIIRLFRSKNHENLLIMEYLVPFASVSKKRRLIPRAVLNTARWIGGLRALTHYTGAQAKRLVSVQGGKAGKRFTLKDMERLRTSKNRYFRRDNEGWIEILTARI